MKNKNMRRACAWLLTLCAALPVLASCGGEGFAVVTEAATEAATETTVETEPLDPLEARKLVDDELGEKDLGGYEFRVMVSEAGGRLPPVRKTGRSSRAGTMTWPSASIRSSISNLWAEFPILS